MQNRGLLLGLLLCAAAIIPGCGTPKMTPAKLKVITNEVKRTTNLVNIRSTRGMPKNFLFGPDGVRLALLVPVGRQQAVMLDGTTGPAYDQAHSLVFSPDGRHFAYAALRGKQQFVVADGMPGKPYDAVSYLQFLPRTGQICYPACTGDLKTGKWRLVTGAQEGPIFDRVECFRLTGDGRHLYYIGTRDVGGGRRSNSWSSTNR